jgi:hypothetical protein
MPKINSANAKPGRRHVLACATVLPMLALFAHQAGTK